MSTDSMIPKAISMVSLTFLTIVALAIITNKISAVLMDICLKNGRVRISARERINIE
jgi:hypothetical protein